MRLVGSRASWAVAVDGGRVLGIDPGSRVLGWGVVEPCGTHLERRDSGTVAPRRDLLAERLAELADEIASLVERFRPTSVAVERAFVGRNSASALRIGEVRGAILATVGRLGLPVFDYPPATVKLAVAGSGLADKTAVAHGVSLLLRELRAPGDATDALAVAICHLRHAVVAGRVSEAGQRAPRVPTAVPRSAGMRSLLRTRGVSVRVRR